MRKTYPFVIAFLLSAVIVFSVANVLVLKYEKRARGELEKNVFLIIDAIQSRLQTFLDVENDRDLLSTVMREIMDENEDLVCVRILDSLHNPYFEIGKDNACSEYAKFCNNKRDKKKNIWIIKEKSGDVFVFYNTVYGVFGKRYGIFYVLKTHIFSPLYSLKLYFNVLAFLFLLMEFLSFLLLVKIENKLTRYRETLISFEQAVMLDRLAGSLAHEIKNPLFVLSGNIELSDLPESEKKLLLSEIKRIKGIVARYESVFKKTQKTWCEPDTVLKDIAKLFAAQFEKKGLFMNVSCEKSLSIEIPEDQFKQIAINLVMNALQANSPLEIRCYAESKGIVRIRFCSEGRKIPEDIRKRMFEPYFTTRKEGTGLGLFVAKTIAEGYGGKLNYEYDKGKNCFILEAVSNENTDS